MRVKLSVCLALAVTLSLILSGLSSAKPAKKGPLLEETGLPTFPGAKLITEINLPAGKLLDTIAEQVGPWLGLEELKQLSALTYWIDPSLDAQQIIKFYELSIAEQQWKTLVRTFDRNSALAIFFNEKDGMLIMNVGAPGKGDREMTVVRIFGRLDPRKLAAPDRQLPEKVKEMVGGLPAERADIIIMGISRIPIGQPISVPPSQQLHLEATRSDICAEAVGQRTAEIRLARLGPGPGDPGNLVRIDDKLVLSLTPKLAVDNITVPAAVPLLFKLTEGSLRLTCGPRPADTPVKLIILSTGAPVTLESFRLVSGTHEVTTVDGEVLISLSEVQGGSLKVDVTGNNITLDLPRDASARLSLAAPSGSIQNLTAVQPEKATADQMSLRMGAGRADISLRAVNGTVCIKTTR